MIKKGVYAASLSVLTEGNALNIDATIHHAVSSIDRGLHGVFFFGSTGQSQLISLTEKKDFISKIVNDRMTAMARVVHGSLFYRLEAPSSSFLSSFRIASLPCIVCIDCCNIVAKTSSMDELTSDGSLGIRDIIQKFDDVK